ncbi:MAG TPA: AAA family ATPase [Phycisphaerales bacterium]|nr:AAA family ATPase [Phycisphaerales bacterium]
MYISRIVVRNFRNLKFLDVSLQDGVTTIVGENNAGKSNLLHAIRLVLDADLPAYQRQLLETDITESESAGHPLQVLVSLEFAGFEESIEASAFAAFMKVDEDLARLTYRFRPSADARAKLESEELSEEDLTLDHYRWEITGGGDFDPCEVEWDTPCGTNIKYSDLSDYLVVFMHALRDVNADLKARTSPLRRLIRALNIPKDQKERLVKILRDANDDIASTEIVEEIGTQLDKRFMKTVGKAFAIDLELGMVPPSFGSLERNLTFLMTHATHSEFEPGQNGLGLNNALYIAILLEYFDKRQENAEAAAGLLLLEEPESHLHPQLQRALYGTLKAHEVQVIISSHSTHITAAGDIDDFVVLTVGDDGMIHAHVPRDNEQLTDPERADLNRYLDATKSTLLFARKVILVEGPAELFLIPPLARKVLGLRLDRLGIAVVPIFGTHFVAFAKLFGPEAIRKRCAIITDRDGEDDDGEAPRDLGNVENEYVKVFAGASTFERELAIPGMAEPLRSAATELGGRNLLAALRAANWDQIGEATLRLAEDRSKGRFGQVLSKYAASATEMPQYIVEALEWITEEPETDDETD